MKQTEKQIKEYFKNAKEVKTLSSSCRGELRDITDIKFIDIREDSIWFDLENSTCKVWGEKDGYAEIISYIEPTFQLSKEQLHYLHSIDSVKSQIEEWFPIEFETKFNTGDWVKTCDGGCFKINSKDENGYLGYGTLLYNGSFYENWHICFKSIYEKSLTLATITEVEQALISEAKKRGFKEGVKFKNMYTYSLDIINDNVYEFRKEWRGEKNILFLNNYVIFKDGIWATPISEPIEVTLEEIANLKGCSVEQLIIKE